MTCCGPCSGRLGAIGHGWRALDWFLMGLHQATEGSDSRASGPDGHRNRAGHRPVPRWDGRALWCQEGIEVPLLPEVGFKVPQCTKTMPHVFDLLGVYQLFLSREIHLCVRRSPSMSLRPVIASR